MPEKQKIENASTESRTEVRMVDYTKCTKLSVFTRSICFESYTSQVLEFFGMKRVETERFLLLISLRKISEKYQIILLIKILNYF